MLHSMNNELKLTLGLGQLINRWECMADEHEKMHKETGLNSAKAYADMLRACVTELEHVLTALPNTQGGPRR